ncbi:hypothetical protein AYL99_00089 [Fonsecaea erecta]|uniref:BZIP domain-containing protein n=1 Tax=Fonsecaea erecta TaxID=1367422 RepID=A0A178ZWP6_9EURO|nr:hypothetical protein AYL99_00089 [Fonsecaea erecta]OAP64117.1 hypothetical protein AYL99_00089 [Fonsecaea erecta]
MSVPSQRPTQPPRHSHLSTSIVPGLVPQGGFPQHHGLSQEDIDGLFSFDAFPQQNFDEWSRQVSAEEMWQQDHGLFEGFWASGPGVDHQGASPMSISGHVGQHGPRKVSTPDYPTNGMPYGLRLEYDGNDELPVGGEGVGDRQERQRSEATDNNSTGAESTKADSPSEQKRKMQNRQAQRAFRERKVKYVQDLEKQVKDLLLYAESLKHENQMLRARGQWLSNQLKSLHRQASSKRGPS